MRVIITGASGLIGSALARSLLADGHEVIGLTRDPARADLPPGVRAVAWDGRSARGWGQLVEGAEAVVNLAGANLAAWPWTAARKQRFWSSRVDATRAVVQAIEQASRRPRVLLQGSAIGYYGPRGMDAIRESDAPGDDFSARLCRAWEEASLPVESLGVRRVLLRTAVVLAPESRILSLMALPVRLFLGGPLGAGTQGFSWIHIADHVRAMRFLMEKPCTGAYNLSAPEPLSNADFTRLLARRLKRPYWFPTPAFLLRLALGEMSVMVLGSQYVKPERLLAEGFRFEYPDAARALQALFPAA